MQTIQTLKFLKTSLNLKYHTNFTIIAQDPNFKSHKKIEHCWLCITTSSKLLPHFISMTLVRVPLTNVVMQYHMNLTWQYQVVKINTMRTGWLNCISIRNKADFLLIRLILSQWHYIKLIWVNSQAPLNCLQLQTDLFTPDFNVSANINLNEYSHFCSSSGTMR